MVPDVQYVNTTCLGQNQLSRFTILVLYVLNLDFINGIGGLATFLRRNKNAVIQNTMLIFSEWK